MKYYKQLFAVEENTTITTDIEPAISIDYVNRINDNISTLLAVLGLTELIPMSAGATIKRYKTTAGTLAEQVAEGDVIGLSKVTRKALDDVTLTLKKYRKLTTAEAIQRSGYNNAVNDTDAKLIAEVRKDVKKDFFTMLGQGTGTATAGADLQKACANLWGAMTAYYEDMDVTPVYFVNPVDVATYLGQATITTQEAFGFTYLENFLGLGNAIISANVTAGAPIATVAQNLNGAYVPANGDVANAFGLTYDASGLVGMTHNAVTERASVETLVLSGVSLFPEDVAGVFKGSVSSAS